MTRIRTTFDKLHADGRQALIPYVTAGDPDLSTTAHILDALVEGGADVIELGMPFSDPMADGPVIQRAMERAIAKGASLERTLELARGFRERHPDTPLILFGYLNPLYQMGLEEGVKAAAEAGIDGLLIVDLPSESASEVLPYLDAHGLNLIGLFTPTTTEARVADMADTVSGFAYCVSVSGVTGGSVQRGSELQKRVEIIQRRTGLPTAVGFGVRTPEDAAEIARFADGVVVGSALVHAMEGKPAVEAPAVAQEFIASLRSAMDNTQTKKAYLKL